MKLFEKGVLSSKKAGYAFSLHVACYLVTVLITAIIMQSLRIESGEISMYLGYLVSPVAIIVSSLIFFYTTDTPLKKTAPLKCGLRYYILAILLAFGLMFSLGWVNQYTIRFLQIFGYQPREVESYLPSLQGGGVVLALFIIALLPSLCEEFLFRGNILNNLEEGVGTIRAVFLTGFCFSLFHANPEQTVYQFICGCAFSLITVRAKSIMPAILMHFINNSCIIVCAAFGWTDAVGNLAVSELVYTILTILSAVCLIFVVLFLIFDKKPIKSKQQGSVKEFFTTASVAVAALAVMWISALF